MRKALGYLPFHVDVAHFLTGDAEVIQDDVLGIPDNATQVEPGRKSPDGVQESFVKEKNSKQYKYKNIL